MRQFTGRNTRAVFFKVCPSPLILECETFDRSFNQFFVASARSAKILHFSCINTQFPLLKNRFQRWFLYWQIFRSSKMSLNSLKISLKLRETSLKKTLHKGTLCPLKFQTPKSGIGLLMFSKPKEILISFRVIVQLQCFLFFFWGGALSCHSCPLFQGWPLSRPLLPALPKRPEETMQNHQ